MSLSLYIYIYTYVYTHIHTHTYKAPRRPGAPRGCCTVSSHDFDLQTFKLRVSSPMSTHTHRIRCQTIVSPLFIRKCILHVYVCIHMCVKNIYKREGERYICMYAYIYMYSRAPGSRRASKTRTFENRPYIDRLRLAGIILVGRSGVSIVILMRSAQCYTMHNAQYSPHNYTHYIPIPHNYTQCILQVGSPLVADPLYSPGRLRRDAAWCERTRELATYVYIYIYIYIYIHTADSFISTLCTSALRQNKTRELATCCLFFIFVNVNLQTVFIISTLK